MPLFNFCNVKFVLCACIVLNAASLGLFYFFEEVWVLCVSRFLVGFFQVSL